MEGKKDERGRLSGLMEERRLQLGLRWKQVAEAGGISYESIRAVRNGTADMRALTRHGIEVGLRWEPGSVQLILDGGDPVPVRPAPALVPEQGGGVSPAADDDPAQLLFADPIEQAIWRQTWLSEEERAAEIKALRMVRSARDTNRMGNTGTALTGMAT